MYRFFFVTLGTFCVAVIVLGALVIAGKLPVGILYP